MYWAFELMRLCDALITTDIVISDTEKFSAHSDITAVRFKSINERLYFR